MIGRSAHFYAPHPSLSAGEGKSPSSAYVKTPPSYQINNKKRTTIRNKLLIAGAAMLAALPVQAQGSFPDKLITFVVPFPRQAPGCHGPASWPPN